MSDFFNNKVVWITGASSGIGRALAVALARKGARLILSSRRREDLEAAEAACAHALPGAVWLLPFDLEDAEALPAVVDSAIAAYGHIDILINNGGMSQFSLAKETNMSVFRKIMEVDFFGNIALSRYLAPHFIARGAGHIAVLSSVMGLMGSPSRSAYAAAKHALHGFYDSLRAELCLESKNIFVTLVCPGYVRTNVSINAIIGNGEKYNTLDKTIEQGVPVEVCAAKIINAIKARKRQIVFGGLKETSGVYINRFFPRLYAYLITKVSVR